MPAQNFLSAFWPLLPAHLQFPVFRILHGESILSGLSRSCTNSCMPCFRLSLKVQIFPLPGNKKCASSGCICNSSGRQTAAGSTNYAEAVTLLWLIIWTITERQAFMSDCFLIGKQENTYSTYEKCIISFLQVTEILHLSCSVFIDLRAEKYNRYLSKKKRWRINQEDEFHSAVLPGLPA